MYETVSGINNLLVSGINQKLIKMIESNYCRNRYFNCDRFNTTTINNNRVLIVSGKNEETYKAAVEVVIHEIKQNL